MHCEKYNIICFHCLHTIFYQKIQIDPSFFVSYGTHAMNDVLSLGVFCVRDAGGRCNKIPRVPLLCFHRQVVWQVALQNTLTIWLVLWETSAFCSLMSQRFWGNNIIMLLFSLGAVFNDRNCINTTGSPHTPTHCHHHNGHNLLWFSFIKLYSAGLIIFLQWIKISRNVSYTF